jgi:hypothetical protein
MYGLIKVGGACQSERDPAEPRQPAQEDTCKCDTLGSPDTW